MKREDNLTKMEIYNIIDQLQMLSVKRLGITGGEPLCDKNLFDYLKYAQKKIPTIVLATNGYLMEQNVITKLKSYNVNKVTVSLDGTKEFHDSFRGRKGAFEHAIKAIKLMVDAGMEVKVRSVITKYNAKNILNLMDITNGFRIKRHEMLPVCPMGRTNKEMVLTSEEYKQFLIQAIAKIKSFNPPNIVFQLKPVFHQDDLFKAVNDDCREKSLTYNCDAFDTSMEIGSNGEVYGCSFVRIPVSNIREQGISSIWYSEEAIKLGNEIMNHNQIGECAECADNAKCNGGCYANKLYGEGTDKKDIYCFVKRRKNHVQ